MILCGKQENMYILQENKRFLREGKKKILFARILLTREENV